jgi:hypothetical protein
VGPAGEAGERVGHADRVGHGHEPRAGGHDLADESILDVEDPGEHVALGRIDQTARCAGPVEPASSSGEWTWAWLWSTWRFHQPISLNAEPLNSATSGRNSHWLTCIGRQGRHRQPLGVAQRDGLGQQLAEHDLHCGDRDEHDEHGDATAADAAQRRFEQRGELCLAVGTGDEAAEGDADLARSDVGVETLRVGQDRQQPLRRGAPGGCILLDPGAPGPDRRELGRDVQRVERHHDSDHERAPHRYGLAVAPRNPEPRSVRALNTASSCAVVMAMNVAVRASSSAKSSGPRASRYVVRPTLPTRRLVDNGLCHLVQQKNH